MMNEKIRAVLKGTTGGEAVGQAQSTDLGLITVECQFYRSRRDTLISANNRLKASEVA